MSSVSGLLSYRPMDRDDARQLRQLHESARRGRIAYSVSNGLYVGLAITGWVTTTCLATAGLFVALFFAAGNGTFDGFFKQVALLSTHYGQVDAVARAPFNRELSIACAIVFAITGFFRRASLISIFRTGGRA